MHDTGKGYNMGDPQKFLGALLQNAVTSRKDPSRKAKLPPAYLDLPATSPLIDSCTRKYRDWTEECLAPEGDERAAPEEHFVWLSKDYTPYDNDAGLPFVPPDFMLGLLPVKDWPRWAGEPPWVLDPKGRPKPVRNVPVDSTSSMDEGKKKKKKKKKYRRSKKTGNPELKVTTRGKGADTPVWTHAGSIKDSSSSSDSQSDGDSGLGSNPSFQPRRDTNTEPRWGATPRLSLDPTKEPVEDDPLSDRSTGNGHQDMPNANKQQGDHDAAESGPGPVPVPEEAQEGAWLGDDRMEASKGGEPQEPLEPYQTMLQGFQTVSQILSVAYGAASAEIQIIVRKSLGKTTVKDRTFVWGASGAIRQWVDSVRPGSPSCSASWPASLVERVTPAPQKVPGSSKTPTKSHPPSGAAKTTPNSGKRSHQSARQVAGSFWRDLQRGKEDAGSHTKISHLHGSVSVSMCALGQARSLSGLERVHRW